MEIALRDTLQTIIEKALEQRGNHSDDYECHLDFAVPNYVVRLCQVVLEALKTAGASTVTLRQLVQLESTCTGADYSHKLALRASRLAEGL